MSIFVRLVQGMVGLTLILTLMPLLICGYTLAYVVLSYTQLPSDDEPEAQKKIRAIVTGNWDRF